MEKKKNFLPLQSSSDIVARMFAFFKGILLGLGLVMPLGPLNIFIFNNSSMQKRFISIFPAILVAAICDLSLIFFAVCGVDVISKISWFKPIIMVVGIIFLFVMGLKMWKATQKDPEAAAPVLPLTSQLSYSASLALLNPHAILDTFVVIGAVSTTFIGFDKHAFTAGCMFSDLSWFLFLGVFGYFLRRLVYGPKILYFINKISAAIMILLSFQLLIDLKDAI